jgi:two-component system phosphate regulon sensor histidine kinase PhoR
MLAAFTITVFLSLSIGYLIGTWRHRSIDRSASIPDPSREQLLAWLDQAPMGWLVVDKSNRIKRMNARAQRLLQIPISDPLPSHLSHLNRVEGLTELVEDVRSQQQPKRLEWNPLNQEIELFAFPGQHHSVAIIFQSRRSILAQLNQQERWVSDVAHELKTPLTALLLVADSLAARVTDQNSVLVERLLKELRRMRELVADLLELSRLENVLPGNGIHLERIEVNQLLNEVRLCIQPIAEEKKVQIRLRNPTHQKINGFLYGHQQRLHRALLNLLENALRYSPIGSSIEIEVQSSGDWLRIGIRDHGPGLSEQDLEHMFERFYRGDTSRFRGQRGASGLGLAIVQQIAISHGGRILGENSSDGGARFELRLPLNAEKVKH